MDNIEFAVGVLTERYIAKRDKIGMLSCLPSPGAIRDNVPKIPSTKVGEQVTAAEGWEETTAINVTPNYGTVTIGVRIGEDGKGKCATGSTAVGIERFVTLEAAPPIVFTTRRSGQLEIDFLLGTLADITHIKVAGEPIEARSPRVA
jgi:hypothetical protein